ncbi:Rieske 2Fe-2S domain-containing protein [Halomonas shantousis]
MGYNVIVIRSEDGIIRAFLNTCRHRGAPLTNESCGNNPHFRCPFHKWSILGAYLSIQGLA